tara:strand:+ start:7318 stop:8571 length:1254 start_codon:yes stop_codon:yes gene_type:complete
VIYVFIVFFTLVCLGLLKKKYPLNHPHFIILSFVFLYTVLAYFHSLGPLFGVFPADLSLTKNMEIAEIRITISLIFILTFYAYILFSNRNLYLVNFEEYEPNKSFYIEDKSKSLLKISKFGFISLYPLALYLSYVYSWQDIWNNDFSLGHSLAAQMKNLLLVMFSFIVLYDRKKIIFLFLILYIFLAIIDTQRTNLFIALLMIFFRFRFQVLTIFIFGTLSLLLLSWIAFSRLQLEMSFGLFLFPFVAESVFGSYSLSQSILINQISDLTLLDRFYFLISIPIETFLIFFRDIFLVLFNISFSSGIESVANTFFENGILEENYSPMGGSYFIAEYNLIFPFFGASLACFIYMFCLKSFLRFGNSSLALLLISSIPIMIKATPFNYLKYIIAISLIYLLFVTACFYLHDSFNKNIKNN